MGFGDRRGCCCCLGLRGGCIAIAILGLVGHLSMAWNVHQMWAQGITWPQAVAVVTSLLTLIGNISLLYGAVKRREGPLRIAQLLLVFGMIVIIFWVGVYIMWSAMGFMGRGEEVWATFSTNPQVHEDFKNSRTPEELEAHSLGVGVGFACGAAFVLLPCLFLWLYFLSVVYSYYLFLRRGGYQPQGADKA